MKKVFIFYLAIVVISTRAQEKYGYFNYNKIEQMIGLEKRASEFLSAFSKHLDDSLTILNKKIESAYQTAIPHNIKLDSIKRKEIETSLNKLLQDIIDFQASAEKRYLHEQNILKSVLRDKVYNTIENFSKKNGIRSLVDKEAVMYCPDCTDFTDKIIDYLKESKQKE